jgi:hypothetical protein
MNESLIKYLAGLLDADGSLSFSFKRDYNREDHWFIGIRMTLCASDNVDTHGFVRSLPNLTGMGSISSYGEQGQFVNWTINKRSELEMILPRIIKHMVIKAQHWQWLLDFWREVRAKPYGERSCNSRTRVALIQASKESRKLRHGPVKPKKHPTWAWLAGYLDGDGWYRHRYSSQQNYWSMSVGAVAHTNDRVALDFLQQSFGGSILPHGQSENVLKWVRNLGKRDRSFALRFLPNVAKHSQLKRHKIDMMIHHHRQRLSDSSAKAQATV